MKNILTTVALLMATGAAFAQGLPVSASYEAPVSASAVARDDVSAPPSVAAMDCCTVSSPVSMAYDGRVSSHGRVSSPAQADEGSDSLAMAGMGFGLVGLVGVSKLARRKKQKGTETM